MPAYQSEIRPPPSDGRAHNTKAVVINSDLYVCSVKGVHRERSVQTYSLAVVQGKLYVQDETMSFGYRCVKSTDRLPKPKFIDLMSSRRFPESSNHLSRRNFSGSGKTSGERPIDLREYRIEGR